MSDGSLRTIFRDHIKRPQWTPIETGATAQGVPDMEYCFPGGVQGWVENKKTGGWAVTVRAEQVGWLLRRARMGGRCFIAIRRLNGKSDELYMVHGRDAEQLQDRGLKGANFILGTWSGGPAKWDWAAVERLLVYNQRN